MIEVWDTPSGELMMRWSSSIEFVAGLWFQRGRRGEAEQLLRRWGWRRLYQDPSRDGYFYARWWLAWWLGPLLALRDRTAIGWGLHCYEMGWIKNGDLIPWPRWLRWRPQ